MYSLPTDSASRASARRGAAFALLLGCLSLGGCESVSLDNVTPALEDDSALADAVRAKLDATPQLGGSMILVKSLDGDTIRLSGTVSNDGQRNAAERTAASVPGVGSVVNTIFLND